MTEWIETELKLGLAGHEDWRRLRQHLGPGRVLNQENTFFDRPERVYGTAGIGVRLRAEEKARLLAVKGHGGGHGSSNIKRRIELESPLSLEAFDQALLTGLDLAPRISDWQSDVGDNPEIQGFLSQLETLSDEGPLTAFGSFSNRREICPLTLSGPEGPLHLELEIDQTNYPGGRVDYEIEVELKKKRDGPPHANAWLEQTHRALILWLDRELGIQTFSVNSKLARFSQILEADSGRPT